MVIESSLSMMEQEGNGYRWTVKDTPLFPRYDCCDQNRPLGYPGHLCSVTVGSCFTKL